MWDEEYIIGYKTEKKYYDCVVKRDYDKALEILAEWESRGLQTIIRVRNYGVIEKM